MDLALSRLLAHVCGWRLLEQNGYLPIFWEPWVLKSPHCREGWRSQNRGDSKDSLFRGVLASLAGKGLLCLLSSRVPFLR